MTGAVCLADILSNGIIILQEATIRSLREAAGGLSEVNTGSRSLCCGSHLTLKASGLLVMWSDLFTLLENNLWNITGFGSSDSNIWNRQENPTGSVGIRKRSLGRRANRIPDWEGMEPLMCRFSKRESFILLLVLNQGLLITDELTLLGSWVITITPNLLSPLGTNASFAQPLNSFWPEWN